MWDMVKRVCMEIRMSRVEGRLYGRAKRSWSYTHTHIYIYIYTQAEPHQPSLANGKCTAPHPSTQREEPQLHTPFNAHPFSLHPLLTKRIRCRESLQRVKKRRKRLRKKREFRTTWARLFPLASYFLLHISHLIQCTSSTSSICYTPNAA